MREIGFVLAGTVVTVAVAVCMLLASVFGKSDAERCSASCGPGRFKAWTAPAIGGLNQPNIPEKCECEASK